MKKIPLNQEYMKDKETVLIFAEGTILKPKSLFSLYNHNAYLPIGNAVELITFWSKQDINIVYCTSRKNKSAQHMADLLNRYGFRGVYLIARDKGETYKNIIESLQPNILIEDDCKSIGGAWQMCITKVEPKLKEKIVAIAVAEFKGIDHLPKEIGELKLLSK